MTAPEKDHQQLRRDAETRLGDHSETAPETRGRPTEVLLHELRVHQIELEMQNDELRQAREAIEESRNRYQDLYDFAPIGYLTLNHTAVIVEANLRCADLFGMARNALLNRHFTDCVSPVDRQHWSRQFMDMSMNAADQGEMLSCELALTRADASQFPARLYCLRRGTGGESPVVRIALTDITELKLAEQALIEASHRKDEFLAMLGHELRNPLTPIRNAAHVLGRLGSREPLVRWAQEIIERQVVHLTLLVDDLLDVSRIVSGKIRLRQEPTLLARMVDQALGMARPLIEAKGHRIGLRLPELPVWLQGDPVRLVQVLVNLLDNAAKYTPEGGRIELAASIAEGMIEIRVVDNGIGIPGKLRPHIFDLFQQGERELDRAQGGLGIGLTLTKRLVEMHGGRIEAASAGPGLGSEFRVWLPTLADAAEAAPDGAAAGKCVPKTAPTPALLRVLVVDDEPAVADSIAVLLAIEGHEVRTLAHGEMALELARDFRPRLVLLDIGLHGMDGYEVARRLRAQQDPNEKLCLVAVTGYGHEEARSRAGEAGFDRYLVKPVIPETLFELISDIRDTAAPRAHTGDF